MKTHFIPFSTVTKLPQRTASQTHQRNTVQFPAKHLEVVQ